MTRSTQESPEQAAIDALRADLQGVPPGARERVRARLASSVGGISLQRSFGDAPPGTTAKARWLRSPPLTLGTSFVLGGLCGAVLYGALRTAPPARVVFVDRVTARTISPPSEPAALPSATSAAPSPRSAPGSVNRVPSVVNVRSAAASLAEQQALLDVARAAFARGDYGATLSSLKAHGQRFPKSMLGEERAALQIKALAAMGRMMEAHALAAHFQVQFPQSLLLPSVNDSLRKTP